MAQDDLDSGFVDRLAAPPAPAMDVEEVPGVELPADVDMAPAEPVAAAEKRPSTTKLYSSRCRMQALEYDL